MLSRGHRLVLVGLLGAVLAACATGWDASIPPRTVRLVLAVDDAFQFHAGWEDELQQAVASVSAIFERKAGIRFESLRVVRWQAPPLGDGRALDDLLVSVPADDADVVVGVSGGCDHTHAGSARVFSRVALVTTGCVPFLQKRAPTLQQLLAHELAHVFGAFHPAPGVRSIMRGGPADDWDGQTLRVMRLMRGFDFRRGIEGVDAPTRAAYTRIYDEGHDPGDVNGIAVALRNEGRLLVETGEPDAARQRFLEAATLAPQWYQPYSDLGLWHARRKQPREAVRLLREAAARAEKARPEARLAIARRLDTLGDRDGALGVLEDTVRLAPASSEARLELGGALLRRNRAPEAETHLREAVRLAPTSAEAHGQLAVALGTQGRYDDSIAANQKALALKPDWAAARGNLGYGLAKAGRVDDAIREYRAALALDPADTRTRHHLVDALLRAARGEEAVAEARLLVTRERSSTQAWQRLIAALMASRRYSEAWAEVQRAASAGVVVPAATQDELRRKLGAGPAPVR